MHPLDSRVVEFVRGAAGSDEYAACLRDSLLALCGFNTAADPDLRATASRERHLFDWIQQEASRLTAGKAISLRPPMDPAIEADPACTPPGYAADKEGKVPSARHVYADRGNLIISIGDGCGSLPVVQHAHVDVVPPWTPPRVEGGRIVGRGACDDKAQVAVMLAQIRLLSELERHLRRPAERGLVYQFAIDEEIGGNGSLSLTMDPRFAGSPMIVHECTDLVPYCAHRGCVYYRCRVSAGEGDGRGAFEAFPYVVAALDEEGERFRAETQHPLFGVEHVQANPGLLASYGTTPGSVCDHMAVVITVRTQIGVQDTVAWIERGLSQSLGAYLELHGDKTRDRDPATGRPRLERHFSVRQILQANTPEFRIDIHGIGGHMGALDECDNAITKAAYLLRGLLASATGLVGGATMRLAENGSVRHDLVLEGGQGFTPCHRMEDVKARLAAAARRGVQAYCTAHNRRYDDHCVEMSFDRLHNDAYAADPGIEPMQALMAARDAVGLPPIEVVGWRTSCDARLYHARGYPVAIFGAGKLEVAHSDHEYVDIADMQKALAISTLAVWKMSR